MTRPFSVVVAITLVAGLHASTAKAQLSEISVGIDGLACASCPAKAEKNLRSVPGISGVRIAETDSTAHLTLKAGAMFEPEKLRAAVELGGEKVRGFNLQMCANVDQEKGRVFVHAPGPKTQRFTVRGEARNKELASVPPGALVCLKAKVVSTTSPIELDLTDLLHP